MPLKKGDIIRNQAYGNTLKKIASSGIDEFYSGSIADEIINTVKNAKTNQGYLDKIVTVEHYHDLGKYLFAFTVFYCYIAGAQFYFIGHESVHNSCWVVTYFRCASSYKFCTWRILYVWRLYNVYRFKRSSVGIFYRCYRSGSGFGHYSNNCRKGFVSVVV